MRRVVITGMGALSALGTTAQSCFDNLIAGHRGIRPHPTHTLPVSVGYVDFDVDAHFSKMQLLGLDRVSQLAIVAAEQAMQQAQAAEPALDRLQMGVFWGTGGGGCESTEHAYAKFFNAGGEQKKLLTVPAAMIHAAAAQVAMRGYHLWGIPYVKLMRKYPSFAKLAEHPTRWFAEDIAYRMGVLSKPNYKGWLLREVLFRPVCFGIGLFAKARDWQALWRDGVTPSGVRS